ncbi:hypothetical protein ACQJBY_018819 [Aegilops geniculata]
MDWTVKGMGDGYHHGIITGHLFLLALLARLQHQFPQLSLSALTTLSYSKREVGPDSCPLKADRKEESSASSSEGVPLSWKPWCRGGWRPAWRRQ